LNGFETTPDTPYRFGRSLASPQESLEEHSEVERQQIKVAKQDEVIESLCGKLQLSQSSPTEYEFSSPRSLFSPISLSISNQSYPLQEKSPEDESTQELDEGKDIWPSISSTNAHIIKRKAQYSPEELSPVLVHSSERSSNTSQQTSTNWRKFESPYSQMLSPITMSKLKMEKPKKVDTREGNGKKLIFSPSPYSKNKNQTKRRTGRRRRKRNKLSQ